MANSKESVLRSGGNAASAGISAVAVAACVVMLFALSACFSPYQENYGTFNINFGDAGGRAIIVDGVEWDINPAALVYSVLLDGPGGPHQKENINFGEKVNFSVTPGTWDIDIKAYQLPEKQEAPVLKAVGKRTVKINPGKNGTVVVEMMPPPPESEPDDPPPDENDEPISYIAINVTAPVRGGTPFGTEGISTDERFAVDSVFWYPADIPFQNGTVYKVTITLSALEGYIFAYDLEADINGEFNYIIEVVDSGRSAAIEITFEATSSKQNGAEVAAPTLVSYEYDESNSKWVITVNAVDEPETGQGVEYAISNNPEIEDMDSLNWGESNSFDLTDIKKLNVSWYVYARSAENDDYEAGLPVCSEAIKAPVFNITVEDIVNEAENIFAEGDITISRSGTETNAPYIKINIELAGEGFNVDSVSWYIDGAEDAVSTDTSITLDARNYILGLHYLTLDVMYGDVPYSKYIAFTVEE